MKTTIYEDKRYKGWRIHKLVSNSGRTKLTLGIVGRTYKTEQEAMQDMDNFLAVATDIMEKEYGKA